MVGAAGMDDLSLYSPEELEKIEELSPVPPLPPDKTNAFADNEKAAALGQALFFDKRLSCAGNVSCATCHDPQYGWSDARALPKVFLNPHMPSAKGSSKRRVPSLWNTAYNPWQFWDGRADSLWSQSLGPPENSIEMEGGSRLQYAHAVYDDKTLRGRYEGIFGGMPDLSDLARFPLKGCPRPDDGKNADNLAWESMAPGDQKAVNRALRLHMASASPWKPSNGRSSARAPGSTLMCKVSRPMIRKNWPPSPRGKKTD